jgi:hypothetical protein
MFENEMVEIKNANMNFVFFTFNILIKRILLLPKKLTTSQAIVNILSYLFANLKGIVSRDEYIFEDLK